jgi:hypothetical protein
MKILLQSAFLYASVNRLFHEKFAALCVRAVAVLAALPVYITAVSWRVTTLSLVDKDVSEENVASFFRLE